MKHKRKKKKKDKLDYLEINIYCALKEIFKNTKRQATDQVKMVTV